LRDAREKHTRTMQVAHSNIAYGKVFAEALGTISGIRRRTLSRLFSVDTTLLRRSRRWRFGVPRFRVAHTSIPVGGSTTGAVDGFPAAPVLTVFIDAPVVVVRSLQNTVEARISTITAQSIAAQAGRIERACRVVLEVNVQVQLMTLEANRVLARPPSDCP